MPDRPEHVLFVFVDGIGIGECGHNPFCHRVWEGHQLLSGGQPWSRGFEPVAAPDRLFKSIDANLDMDGLPQSGTGQASLFTGFNCARLAGRHYGPFPHSKTWDCIHEHSIFQRVVQAFPTEKDPAAFANAYPPVFFDRATRTGRWTVTTRAARFAGVELRTLEDVQRSHALTAEITGAAWKEKLSLEVPLHDPEQAGQLLVALAREHRFLLFEYFLTDKAGHEQDMTKACNILEILDAFYLGIFNALPPDMLFLLSSDHGNLEDLSTKSHTRNPVPLVARGPGAHHLDGANSIDEIVPHLMQQVFGQMSRTQES